MIRRSGLVVAAAAAIALAQLAPPAHAESAGEPFGQPYWQILQQAREQNRSSGASAAPVEIEQPEEYVAPIYEPDPLYPLADGDLQGPMPSEAIAASIHFHLREGNAPILRVHRDDRRAILDFYSARGFAPLWVGEFGLSTRAERLLGYMSRAAEEGLNPAEYLPESLNAFDGEAAPSGSALDLAKLDVELTIAALKYARHASAGRVVPSRLGRYIDVHPEPVAAEDALVSLGRTVRPDTYLAALHPTNVVYTGLRDALARLRQETRSNADDDVIVPSGDLLKLGARDGRVPYVQRKLHGLGLLQTFEYSQSDPSELSNLYSEAIVEAVKDFQDLHGLTMDGVVGPATTNAMNADSPTRRLELVTLNMERARWLPRDLGERHVIVNQPAFQLRLYDRGEVVHQTRVIIGKPYHQTPMFSDEMEFVVFNPYWNVPRSIATKEMLPHLQVDASYLDRQGFEVFGPGGAVASSSVDWASYTASTMPYSFRQPPGSSNALGYIKFLFPNRHAVYMHDTPTRHLFERDMRAFSHGCVRVQNAVEFGEAVLGVDGWSRARIDAAIASGRNQQTTLQHRIGVHLAYFTAWADEHGVAVYHDVYGRDAQLRTALGDNRLALKSTHLNDH